MFQSVQCKTSGQLAGGGGGSQEEKRGDAADMFPLVSGQ